MFFIVKLFSGDIPSHVLGNIGPNAKIIDTQNMDANHKKYFWVILGKEVKRRHPNILVNNNVYPKYILSSKVSIVGFILDQ